MIRYYDRQGQPLDMRAWAKLLGDTSYQQLRVDHLDIDDEVVDVSTVWLGTNHNFSGEGPALIFETMIFGGKFDGWQWRWPTEEAALAGHERIAKALGRGEDVSGA